LGRADRAQPTRDARRTGAISALLPKLAIGPLPPENAADHSSDHSWPDEWRVQARRLSS